MTIKKQWMLALTATVFLSILINSFMLSTLINRYFVSYYNENYQEHVKQIVKVAEETLTIPNYDSRQLIILLKAHLIGPITGIQILDTHGQVLADVRRNQRSMQMMGGHMYRNSNQSNDLLKEIDSSPIYQEGKYLGDLNVIRYGSLGGSLEIRNFQISLMVNSIIAFVSVLLLTLIFGNRISRRMSKDIMSTASMAINLDLGEPANIKVSKVEEIRLVQKSLETLHRNLKLKKTSRKKLIDELVHQTRTPLTILNTHLEGFRDGVLVITDEELEKCQIQIANLNEIIQNMSGLIDAEGEKDKVQVEKIEVSSLIGRISEGLRAQFDKKGISFHWKGDEKIWIQADRYKLSQSIYNLITNAYKYTLPGGRVDIHYRQGEGSERKWLEILVRDTGRGIQGENLNKIFDAYYREDSEDEVEGYGIGLYVASQNLEQMGGSIRVESTPGEGSTFILQIPMVFNPSP